VASAFRRKFLRAFSFMPEYLLDIL